MLKNETTICQPVNHCGYHSLIFKHSQPFQESKVGGYDNAFSFTAVGNDLKQKLRLMPIESEITYFIDNQQIATGNLLLQLQQPAAIQRLYQFVGEIRGCIEFYV